MNLASSVQFLFTHQKHIIMIKRTESMRIGARFPVKKNGNMKKALPSPRFRRVIPNPKMMNPIVMTYRSLFSKCNSPSSLETYVISKFQLVIAY